MKKPPFLVSKKRKLKFRGTILVGAKRPLLPAENRRLRGNGGGPVRSYWRKPAFSRMLKGQPSWSGYRLAPTDGSLKVRKQVFSLSQHFLYQPHYSKSRRKCQDPPFSFLPPAVNP